MANLVIPKPIMPVYPRKLRPGCVLDIDFQDIGGKIIDHSGFGNHGINYGSVPVAGPTGWVRKFDGTDDYVSVPHSSSLAFTQGITIEVWFNTATKFLPNGNRMLVTLQNSTYFGLDTNGYAPPYFSLRIGGQQRTLNSNFSLSVNTWYHVFGTYDGSMMRIYVNGILKNSAGPYTGDLDTGASSKFIGKYSFSGYEFWGLIGSLWIYKRAFPPAEVAEIFKKEAWRYGVTA